MTSGNFDWLSEGARRNPEGLLLLAAGAILLMRGKSRSASLSHNSHSNYYDGRYSQDDEWPRGAGRAGNDRQARGAISRATNVAKDYASDITDAVTEAAGDYASTVQDYVGDAGRAIADRSGDLASRAQSTFQQGVERVLRDQPLAIALAGVAAGAAVAVAFPVTSFERDNLGGVGERLNDAAGEGKRMLGTAAKAAWEKIEKDAADKGLTTEGLKNAARDVTEAVKSSLSPKATTTPSESTAASSSGLGSGQRSGPSSAQTSQLSERSGSGSQNQPPSGGS